MDRRPSTVTSSWWLPRRNTRSRAANPTAGALFRAALIRPQLETTAPERHRPASDLPRTLSAFASRQSPDRPDALCACATPASRDSEAVARHLTVRAIPFAESDSEPRRRRRDCLAPEGITTNLGGGATAFHQRDSECRHPPRRPNHAGAAAYERPSGRCPECRFRRRAAVRGSGPVRSR